MAIPARAQVDTNPPGVARVSMIQGEVFMQRGDSGERSAVQLNTPLVAGDKIYTGAHSRAEVQLDWADVIRLDENSELNIATLDQNRIQVQFSGGLGNFSAIQGAGAQTEIDTPNVAVTPRGTGRFRIEVTPGGDTLVTVREGEADVSTPDGSTPVRRGEMITVRGTGNDVRFQIASAPGSDDFDRWNSDRDRIISSAESWRRANPYYTGAQDLDAYGRWDNIPDYGYVWVPRVAVGWAPYRHGRWLWEPYWGWTWVSYEPWGWAPYHYGRWFVHGGLWVWWPGPVTRFYRPVYAPAWVSFLGFGSGVSFSFGFSSIGWIPAGPCDFVSPWWGRYRSTFNVVNITNIYNVRNVNVIAPLRAGDRDSNIRNMMINNQVRYGVSRVEAEQFGRGNGNIRAVGSNELREAKFVAGNVPVVPSRESLRVSDRAPAIAPPAGGRQQQFFSRRVPSTEHESFAQESSQLRESIERDPRFRGPEGSHGAPVANAGKAAVTGPANRSFESRPGAEGGVFSRLNPGEAAGRPGAAGATALRGNGSGGQAFVAQQPAARGEDSGGGWRRFGQQSGGAAGAAQDNANQRGVVVRAPRRSPAVPEKSPQGPGASSNFRSEAGQSAPGFARPNSQPMAPLSNSEVRTPQNDAPAAPRRFEWQGNGQGAEAGESNAERSGGWQRFSEQPRGDAFASAGRSPAAAARAETRPPLELNRPIIQQRSYAERPAPYGGGTRVAPSPRSVPQAGPRGEGARGGAPGNEGRNAGHGGGSAHGGGRERSGR